MKKVLIAAAGIVLASYAAFASAEEVRVAVAANFTAPAKDLQPVYEKATGDKLILSFGATGAFYAQIKNGAPFDILLAADAKTPKKAVEEGHGVAGSTFTYAIGKLVLWSADDKLVGNDVAAVINSPAVKHVAVANAKLAPYGEAARETLAKLGLEKAVEGKTVVGDNIGKTYQFVKTGNAEAGFIALSQCFKGGAFTSGSGYVIPQELYSPINQDAVLLKAGEKNEGAKRFLKFLRESQEAADVRAAYGYGTAK